MDAKTRELVAIGASIAGHCQPCLTYHVGQAKKLGARARDIEEAVVVGHMVEKGAMQAMRNFVKHAPCGSAKDPPACCSGGGPIGKK